MAINLTKGQRIEIELSKARKKSILSGLILCFSLLLASCSFYSKDTYLEDFSEFVTNVEDNYQSYTENDWTVKKQEYEEYISGKYNKFREKLTDKDKKQIGKLKAKYQTIVIKYNAKKLIDDASDRLNQLEGVIDGVLEGINK